MCLSVCGVVPSAEDGVRVVVRVGSTPGSPARTAPVLKGVIGSRAYIFKPEPDWINSTSHM